MRLCEKAKRLGIWNTADIDFRQDAQDWQRLTADEQDILLRLAALFQAGEEAVTLDLLPLIMVVAGGGRLERARGASLDEINRVTAQVIEQDDA